MKRILIVFTGGTFSMKIDDETGGAVPHFSGNELMEMIPDAFQLAEIETYDFGKYPGPHVTPELMLQLSKKIKEFLSTGKFDGVIVTHGTDTLEETAYLLDLTIKTEKPIVVIGSMKTVLNLIGMDRETCWMQFIFA
jgi:L-asparaginase